MAGQPTRRQVVTTAGAAGVALLSGVGLNSVLGASRWVEVSSPTSKTLYEVVRTDAGPYAVGGSGVVIHRTADGWQTVISDGAKGQNKTLHGAAVTDDGNRLWMCGSSGALAEYDVSSGTLTNWSNPNGIGNTFTDVEVTGTVAEKERIYLTMGSGKVVIGKRESKSNIEWDVHDTGGGTTLNAVDFHDDTAGRVVSNGHRVFETTDGGKTWTKIGLDQAQNPLEGLVSGTDHVWTTGGNGQVWRHDCNCHIWTPHSAGSKDIYEIERRNGRFLACGGSGRIIEQVDSQWIAKNTPVGNALLGCAIGDTDIAVGKSGTIIER